MNFIPPQYRILAYITAGLITFFSGYGWCYRNMTAAQELKDAKEEAAAAKIEVKRAEVTQEVEEKIVERIKYVRVKGDQIVKEVPVYVSSDACPLSPGFRVQHDAAAAGELPNPASVPDAASVPAQTLATTVSENYVGCRDNAEVILGWQLWVEEQKKLKR
jgi:hypothetical protein